MQRKRKQYALLFFCLEELGRMSDSEEQATELIPQRQQNISMDVDS
jgi:hypothetical protein